MLRFLLDSVGIAVNPISGGSLYPDSDWPWGYDGNSRSLTAEQVRQVADFLKMTPFATLAVHLPAASRASLYGNARLDLPVVRDRFDGLYQDLINFFDAATSANQCSVFWAA